MFFRPRLIVVYAHALLLTLLCASFTCAQTDESGADIEADPVKLFERGQDAHGEGKLELAIQLYEAAIKLQPEFPEAEFQRGMALNSLNRLPEAEQAFRRAVALRDGWAHPWAMLGMLLVRAERFNEAEQALGRALNLEPKNYIALAALMDLRLRTKAPRESLQHLLKQLQDATANADAPASIWAARGAIERALDDKAAAMVSLDRALTLDARNTVARMERAELRAGAGNYEGAIEDAKAAQGGTQALLLLAKIYAQAGRKTLALATLDALDETAKRLPEAIALRDTIQTDGETGKEGRAALEKLLEREPRNAGLLARLGELYRTDDPARSVEYYARALEIEPRNADYATGYGAALVRARRFADAVVILRRVLTIAPNNYSAHANLANALYELKLFREALNEYKWIAEAKPELAATYFLIAISHDSLGQYEEALAAYQTFLARADAARDQLEIGKVNLRLPSLRAQIKRGEGKKK
jgi:tetratricopeptide (TPR) repeat protein